MKKIISTILSVSLLSGAATLSAIHKSSATEAFAETEQLVTNCKSAYLCDFNSGECIYKYNETERMPIASVCKVMTLTLCFVPISRGGHGRFAGVFTVGTFIPDNRAY